MKGKIAKIAGITLSLSLLLTSLAACGKGTKSEEDNASTASTSSSSTVERVELKVELFDRGDLKPGQEPVDNNQWTKWVQKEFGDKNNIDVKYVTVPRSKEVDQLNLLMAANEAPDISFTYDRGVVYNYVKNGGLTDLGDIINKNGQNLKKYLGDEILSYGVFNEKQYAIPAKRAIVTTQSMLIRKDWLDKVGMQAPSNTDDFYKVIKAFKDKDPGNLGSKMIPYKLNKYSYQALLYNFTTQMTEEETYVYTEPTTSTDRMNILRPGIKEGLRFLNKLNNEGLVNLDWVLDKDQKQEKQEWINGQIGSHYLNVGDSRYSWITDIKKNVPTAEYITCDPFTNYEGKHLKMPINPYGIYIISPKSSQRATEAVKYLDWMSDQNVLFYLQNGIEGKNYTLKDGIPQLINTDEAKNAFNVANNGDMCIIVNGKELGSTDKNLIAQSLAFPGYEKLYLDAAKISMTDILPNVHFSTPLESDSKFGTALSQKWEELFVKMVSAKPADFDKAYDAAVNEYLAAGGQEMINERKEAYKAMKK